MKQFLEAHAILRLSNWRWECHSDLAIETMATVKAVYRLAGRQCQGFLESIFELINIDLSVPDHSTLSRRVGKLSIQLPVLPKEGACHVVVDSTGVESEWRRGMENPPFSQGQQATDLAEAASWSRYGNGRDFGSSGEYEQRQ